MNKINYVVGDATAPQITNGLRIVAHVANNEGGFGSGFVAAINNKWDDPRKRYREWHDLTGLDLGDIHLVPVSDDHGKLYVANMVAQDGYGSQEKPRAANYGALAACLFKLNNWIDNYNQLQFGIRHPNAKVKSSVIMPRICCGLGGGDWDVVEEIIEATLTLPDIYVYDLPNEVDKWRK